MNPEQEAAQRKVAEGVDILVRSLMRLRNLEEDEALETVRNLPDLVNKIQDNKLCELFEAAAKHPQVIKFDQPNPDEYYPGHPKFMPDLTTKTTFNEHVAQALEPYVTAILNKVAKDRGLQPPETRVVKAVIAQTDWARAAYEAKKMPPKPPPSQLRKFFKKYLGPIESKITGKTATLFGLAMSALMIQMIWQAFGHAVESAGGGVKLFKPYSHWSQHRTQNKLQSKLGIPRRYRVFKTY